MAQPIIIDTESALGPLIDRIFALPKQVPDLYIDLEGNNLGRHGTISLMTVLISSEQRTYLIDITTLEGSAFSAKSRGGRTLKRALESEDIIKVFFDIRNDSDALYSLYSVRVEGIHDLQLMELASRTYPKRSVSGLARCIESDAGLNAAEVSRLRIVKEGGLNLFAPERGGSYAVFDERPLNPTILEYCAQDVAFMPLLYRNYRDKVGDVWWDKIKLETQERIMLSQSVDYDPKGPEKAKAPAAWQEQRQNWRQNRGQYRGQYRGRNRGSRARASTSTISVRASIRNSPSERVFGTQQIPAEEWRKFKLPKETPKVLRDGQAEELERFEDALKALRLDKD